MNAESGRAIWKSIYEVAPARLARVAAIRGAASVFNANIDAVVRVSAERLARWFEASGAAPEQLLAEGPARIAAPSDVLRGLLACFGGGYAREWLVDDEATFRWMHAHLGYDRLQMGGQGGIIANVLAVCGVERVYAHAASLPAEQASLFLDRPNLLSTDADGVLRPARSVARAGDLPLIHWIIEFQKGEELVVGDTRITCPKSNRFIATWDPANFQLELDRAFLRAVGEEPALEYALVSGYQMLRHPLASGGSALARIDDSRAALDGWRARHPGAVVHVELASTQDPAVRRALLDDVAPWADSLGLNEQELIDLLEVMGEGALVDACRQRLESPTLYEGLRRVFDRTGTKRLQLHMFGLYVTIQRAGHGTPPERTRDGMVLAATVAAAKAGTGALDDPSVLLWAHGREVADTSLRELTALEAWLERVEPSSTGSLWESGVRRCGGFDVVAVPTILIEKPVTLVGMGDTISSLSLLGAH